jgi:three-Cys-motif partner protein
MADSLPTIWPLSPHTVAKHRILRGYLNAWLPILANHPKSKRVLYIDGFAGPGEYEGGEEGSPVIALKAVLEHSHQFTTPVRLVFIEGRQDRHKHLREVLKRFDAVILSTQKRVEVVDPICSDCETKLNEVLSKYETRKEPFGPALVFLDQFGYSDVPLELVARIMRHERCEVFSYLHGDGIRRFLDEEPKHAAISRAFGGESWKAALDLPPNRRVAYLAEEYKNVLKAKAGVKFVWHFAMHGEGDKLLYWLFFCTNNIRGLEEMKRAMAKVDASGGSFKFSDASDPAQMILFDRFSDEWLGEHLAARFAGRDTTVAEIGCYVLESTPGVAFKKVLKGLESKGVLEVLSPPSGRRRGSFSDNDLQIRFRQTLRLL